MRLIQKMFVMARLGRLATAVIVMAAGSFCAYGGDVVGKVVVGYQGWLSAPNDGSLVNKWKHTNMECWPDVREYTTTFPGCQFYQNGSLQSAFNGTLGNGQPARMFSNYSDQTVDKHFEWMEQYEIDCAALQRFGSELGDSDMKAYKNGIATKVKNAAKNHGRKYYIMYDISGWGSFQSQIKTDWESIRGSHTNSSAYARENGKPVVCVWGMGFSDRPGSASSWTDVVNWFKGQNCYVIGGVKDKFASDTANKNVYKACNMVMAWRVGKTSSFDTAFATDVAWCNSNSVAYQGHIYPGTSFYNTKPKEWPKNKIKRNHGSLMWSQFAAARLKNVPSVYIAMFDEVQEATQIFKVAENSSQIPKDKYFLTLDADGVACSSDFYLRLTQDGGKMVKKITGYVTSHPTSHTIANNTTVPWVTNLTQSAAGTAITNAGLVVSGVNPEYHATVPAGKIFSQTPGGGTSVPRGSSVALAVSLGPASTTTVPWVTNLTVAAAGTAITNAGLVVSGVSQEYHPTIAAGRIFSQTPGGGTVTSRGSSVALAASLGPQPQLVLNNSFEVNTASWVLKGSSIRSTTTAANGIASLRMNTANSSATQTVAIVSGKTYDISTYVYVAARSSGMVVFDTWDKYDAAGQGQFTFSATNGGWKKYSGSFTATNNSVTLRMFSDSAFVGTAYFDQIELKPR